MSSLGPVADVVDDYGDDVDLPAADVAARDYFADLAFEEARERRLGISTTGGTGWYCEIGDPS